MSIRFDVESWRRGTQTVAQFTRAEDVFSLLNRRVTVPPGCTAIVWGGQGMPRLVNGGSAIESDGVTAMMLVRMEPFELRYQIGGLASADGFDFTASVVMSVHPVSEKLELEAFRRNVMGILGKVDVARLQEYCEEVVRTAVAAFAKARPASDLVNAAVWPEFDGVLLERFKPMGFGSGLALGGDPRVTFASPAFEAARREDAAVTARMRRAEAEAQVRSASLKARREHLSGVSELIEQLKETAAKEPGVGVVDLIKAFDPAQRGELYHGLAATARPQRSTRSILVVAGDEFVRLAASDPGAPPVRRSLASPLGGLRSVRVGELDGRTVFWVGAGRGVHQVTADGESTRTFAFEPPGPLRGGVNSAVSRSDHLYAAHSEVGLIRWPLSRPDADERCLPDETEGARSVRDVQTDAAGRLWFSVDRRVVAWSPDCGDLPVAGDAPSVVAVTVVADGWAFAGLDDGRIVRWAAEDLGSCDTLRPPTSRPVRSLAWLAGGGIPRLLVADDRRYLELLVLGDASATQYRAPEPMRWGFAADDLIAGVNDRRDRLFVWRIETPDEPERAVPVGRLCGHSIQDVALSPADVSESPRSA